MPPPPPAPAADAALEWAAQEDAAARAKADAAKKKKQNAKKKKQKAAAKGKKEEAARKLASQERSDAESSDDGEGAGVGLLGDEQQPQPQPEAVPARGAARGSARGVWASTEEAATTDNTPSMPSGAELGPKVVPAPIADAAAWEAQSAAWAVPLLSGAPVRAVAFGFCASVGEQPTLHLLGQPGQVGDVGLCLRFARRGA
jgi:hypothetical protein